MVSTLRRAVDTEPPQAKMQRYTARVTANYVQGGIRQPSIVEFDQLQPVQRAATRHWYARTQNAVVEWVESALENGSFSSAGIDETLLLLPETAGPRARMLAERIRDKVASDPVHIDPETEITYTISLGVAANDPANPGRFPNDLIQAADQALYQGKQAGKNRVIVAR